MQWKKTKLNGGLSRLHSADEDAVSWLTMKRRQEEDCFAKQLYFLFLNLIMGSMLKIVVVLYDTSHTFNVAVQYLQWKHLATGGAVA